jgi:hypothetical protein
MNRAVWGGFVRGLQEAFAGEKVASIADYLASARGEHHGDMAGLGLMAASSADKLKSQLEHPEDDQQGSLMGGDTGRTGADLTGLALMTAPTIASMAKGTGNRFTNGMNLAGLAALTAPTLDKLQANIRARRAGVDPESKMLMGHKAHALAELGGYGALAAPVVRGAMGGHTPLHSAAMTLGGYGTLAAPAVEDLVQHDEKKRIFNGAGRSATELGGLGLLAGGALTGH